jgi:hypothetical protein
LLYHLLKSNPRAFYEHPILKGFWYYCVETEPEIFTPGLKFANLAITRDMLRRTSIEGQRCYDIGTMEGLIPTLMAKRGAAKVVVMDAINYSEKVRLVQDLHGVYFDYHPNVQLDAVPQFIRNKARMDGSFHDRYDYRADVTVIAGLLYHVFSPFHLLGHARSITREGGIVVIETAAMKRNDFLMQYNFEGQRYIYGWTDTWFPSLPLLDYMLRMCKLQPIDVQYVPNFNYPELIRVAIACRAVPDVIPQPHETIMRESTMNLDHNIFVDTYGDGQRGVPVKFTARHDEVVMRSDGVTVDVFNTVDKCRPYRPEEDELCLRLGAFY